MSRSPAVMRCTASATAPAHSVGEREPSVKGTAAAPCGAVASPTAKAGEVAVELPKFLPSVCDKDNCFPPKTLKPEAKLKVLDGPAVAVDKKYAEEVEKALKAK